jgi:hypothetical protein
MDYFRQLRNDEKRGRYASVITIKAGDFPEEGTPTDSFIAGRLDGKVFIDKIYAVVKTPFAAGSTLTFGSLNENSGGTIDIWFQDLDLSIAGVSYPNATLVDAMINIQAIGAVNVTQEALDSNVGEVQFIIEYVEESATTGNYSK